MAPQQRKQLAVPEREHEWLMLSAHGPEARIILDAEPPRAGENADQERAERYDDRELPATLGVAVCLGLRLTHTASSLAMAATRSAAPGVPSFDRTSARPSSIARRRGSLWSSNDCSVSAT